MDLQIWSKVGDKRGAILALRGEELHRIGVSGSKVTIRRNVSKLIEALQEGQEPSALKAKSVETLAVGSIGRAELSPDQSSIKFSAEGDGGASLEFSSSDNKASEIVRVVLARGGRAFREEKQDIGPGEAVFPPVFFGGIGGVLWYWLYNTAGQLAKGEEIEVGHGRGRGLQRLMILVAETVGMNGTLLIGAALLAMVLGWATLRVVRRPQRIVWQG